MPCDSADDYHVLAGLICKIKVKWELLVSIRLFQHLEDVPGNGSLVWPVSLMHNFYSKRLVLLSLKT